METGIELDELIAIKVMGREHNKTIWSQKPFSPSTDISAAWKVVEKIGQNKFNVEILRRSDGKYFATCKKVGSVSDKLFEVYAKADTAPEAICKAALLTVMEDK